MTPAETTQVRDGVVALTKAGPLVGLSSCPGGPVLVSLAPGEEATARELTVRYGKDVALTVGLTTYDGSPGRSPLCGDVQPGAPLPDGLRVSLTLPTRSVPSGADFQGTVVITEEGPGSFSMDTGQPLEAVVVRPSTRRVVGVYSGAIAGTGYGGLLEPGQPETISVVGGTARCDGGVGSALPPGTYQVIVQVAPETSPHTPAYLTPPVGLRIGRG